MKSVSCFRNLEQFGIKPLTGEADALGYRILCDLTEQGVKVFHETFGIPERTCGHALADNWNSGAVASVMLSDDSIRPLAVMGFYLQGKVMVITDTAVYGLDAMEDVVLDNSGDFYNFVDYANDKGKPIRWPEAYGRIIRIIRPKTSDGQLVQGTRNVHQMTGRVS